jgi:hypothetical protein
MADRLKKEDRQAPEAAGLLSPRRQNDPRSGDY